jgi:DNA-binding response OmpR family regulator
VGLQDAVSQIPGKAWIITRIGIIIQTLSDKGAQMNEKILVVDDDPDILDAVSMILESQGYQVVTARDGVEGLANLKAETPDMLILDLMMPKMDGFAVCKELQDPRWSKYRSIPILILTSVREEASRRRYELETGLELNVEDYVEKPFQPNVLLERVGKLVKKKAKS